jgi:hypothetical protein
MLANNPSVLTGGGVATNVVNGTFQLIGPTGSIALTAQGTNQNITLTPSGTGNVTASGAIRAAVNLFVTSGYNNWYFYSSSGDGQMHIGVEGAAEYVALSNTALRVLPTTASTSTTTGALQVSGGMGVAGAGWFGGTISPQQAATASAPTYVKGAIYFDTTLNKLRVGGATAWETITSI